MTFSPEVLERFWAKVDKSDGCWLWTASVSTPGYGHMKVAGRLLQAHRISYEIAHGAILDGLVIDHLCRVRNCVNPDHMEAVTGLENWRRGESVSAINALKTTCARGHAFDTRPGSTWRICRRCDADSRRARHLAHA